jgi:hypothetical protein
VSKTLIFPTHNANKSRPDQVAAQDDNPQTKHPQQCGQVLPQQKRQNYRKSIFCKQLLASQDDDEKSHTVSGPPD